MTFTIAISTSEYVQCVGTPSGVKVTMNASPGALTGASPSGTKILTNAVGTAGGTSTLSWTDNNGLNSVVIQATTAAGNVDPISTYSGTNTVGQ